MQRISHPALIGFGEKECQQILHPLMEQELYSWALQVTVELFHAPEYLVL